MTLDEQRDAIPPRNQWLQTLRADRPEESDNLEAQPALSVTLTETPVSWSRDLVGLATLDSLRHTFVEEVVREALRRTKGNYTYAAVLLGASRQQIQHLVRKFELQMYAVALRKSAEAQ